MGNSITSFYGTASQIANANGGGIGVGNAMEVPPEQAGAGKRPIHFWLGIVLALIVVRVAYEVS